MAAILLVSPCAGRQVDAAALALSNGSARKGYQQHFRNLRSALLVMRNGYEVLWVSRSTRVTSRGRQISLRRGDYLIHGVPAAKLQSLSTFLHKRTGQRPAVVAADGVVLGLPLEHPRLLVDAQPWSGNYNWYYDTLRLGGFTFRHMFDHRQLAPDPRHFNVLVAPGGGGNIPPKYNQLLKGFVANGGNYVGSCWGAAQAIYPSRVGYGTGNGASIADAYNNEVVHSFGALGGVGVVRLQNRRPDHPVMWGLPKRITNIYWNGPVMRVGPNARVLATLSSIDNTSFQFHARGKRERQQDVDEEKGKALYVVSQRRGEGKVILFGNHPEASSSINPFPVFEMGHQATFNAMLFAVAGKETSWQKAKPRNGRFGSQRFAKISQEQIPRSELLKHLDLAEAKAKGVMEGANFDEDQPAGCYLIRVHRELRQMQQRQAQLERLTLRVSIPLQIRIRRWEVMTMQTCRAVRKALKNTKPRRMNRWNSWWQPIVGPTFERSRELERLIDDCQLYLALR